MIYRTFCGGVSSVTWWLFTPLPGPYQVSHDSKNTLHPNTCNAVNSFIHIPLVPRSVFLYFTRNAFYAVADCQPPPGRRHRKMPSLSHTRSQAFTHHLEHKDFKQTVDNMKLE